MTLIQHNLTVNAILQYFTVKCKNRWDGKNGKWLPIL